MNFRHLLVMCSVVWLAGCASIQSTSESDADSTLKPLSTKHIQAPKVVSLEAEVQADLWERIRKGFAMQELNDEYVKTQEQWYSTRPDYIDRMTTRSSKYLYHIVEELEERKMPLELALLPYIESAFNPQAVSSAKAAGMWQFMPATGEYFELTQNAFRDDRRDVLASTRAALDYLQKLYTMFGDWHLALAAYNWGEGSVSRAIKRNQQKGLGTSYAELDMPNETRNYVPKLQAVKNIIANPEKFEIELPYIENHPYFQIVDIKRDMDIELVARLADVRLEDFKALNPSFHRPTIFAAGITQILLPWDNAKVFKRNLEAYNDDQYASWTVWVAPSTMTVASAAQRVGMSESDLRSVNRIPPKMMIKAGSALMVPRTSKNMADVASHIADNGRLAFAPEVTIVTQRTSVKVLKGDTIAKVAKRHGVSTANLARWNDISTSAKLRSGQMLSLYKTVRISAVADAGKTSNAKTSNSKAANKKEKATPKNAKPVVAKKPAAIQVAQRNKNAPVNKKKR